MEIIGLDNPEMWDNIVRSFSNHDIYYQHGYAMAQYVHGDGTPLLIYYNSPSGRGMCVLIIRDIAECEELAGLIDKKQYFDAMSPYGYGGFIFEGYPDMGDVSARLLKSLRRLGVISVFYRFHPLLGNSNSINGLIQTHLLGHTAAIDLKDKDTIWKNMTSNTRKMVRKALKNGLNVHVGRDASLLDHFISLYYDAMKIKNADRYYFFEPEYFQAIDSRLHNNYEIVYTTLEDNITAMAMLLYSNGYMHYHLGGTKTEYRNTASFNLVLYHAALRGASMGMKYLHLGGGLGFQRDSLFRFKAGFNRRPPLDFHIGRQIVDKEKYDYLLGLRTKNGTTLNSSYFPEYRCPGGGVDKW